VLNSLATRHVLYVSIAFLLCSCGSGNSPSKNNGGGRPATSVFVDAAEVREIADTLESIGTLEANESVIITASVTDYVSGVNFDDGQYVQKGHILVTLADDEQNAELEEAKANLSESLRQLNRLNSIGNNLASRSEIDIAQAAVEANQGRLNAIEARLKDRIVRAPFSGVLSFRRISVGSLVSPGTEITQLQDISVLNLDFSVPEVYLGSLNTGIEIEGRSPSWPDETFTGQITFIDNRIDAATRSVLVRAEIPNAEFRLRSGMLINVSLPLRRRQALVVPESALQQVGASASVFVVTEDSKALKKPVKVGRRLPGAVVIEEGLAEGERVVVQGTLSLRPGSPVKIMNATETSESSGAATGQQDRAQADTPKEGVAAK